MENSHKELGIPTTLGELKQMIADYPDSTSFGFLNQPIQQLTEREINDQTFVSFEEITPIRFFIPSTQLFYMTIGKKYQIIYVHSDRWIIDDLGKPRIVRPLPSEISE